MKEFEKNDIFNNVIEAHPRYEIKLYKGQMYINNTTEGNIKYQNALNVPDTGAGDELYSLDFRYSINSQYLPLI